MDFSLLVIAVCAVLALALVVVFLVYGRSEGTFKFDIGGSAPRAAGGSDESAEKTFSSRLVGLAVAVGGVFTVLLGRLWSMQLVSSDDYAQQAESNRTRTVYTSAPRGRILDRNGEEIVGNRPSLTVVAESSVLDDEVEMQLLASLLGMPCQAVRRKIQDSSEGAQSARTVCVDVSRRVVAFIGEHPALFPGVSVQQRTQRSYPYGTLAAHVVGYTGTLTSDQLKASQESSSGVTYRSGDVVGQTGVESRYESVLQGVRGETTVYVDSSGTVLEESASIAPQSGSDLFLTLDLNVQKAAEESLEKVIMQMRDKGYPASSGSVVAVDCTNGEVIAMASYPTYSPNMFVGGIAAADWDTLSSEDANYPLLNRVIAGQFPSGSTIKPLVTLGALKDGIIDLGSAWYCTGWWNWNGDQSSNVGMNCWWKSGHGAVDIASGLTYSCDVVYYEIGKGYWYSSIDEGIQANFRNFGLGSATGIDLAGEAEGRVPTAEWKWNYWSNVPDEQRSWQGGDNCNICIGQGDLLVTLMQMVDAYCAIANLGTVWRPHVMKSVKARTGDGSVIQYKPKADSTVEFSDSYYDVVKRGMSGVIYEEDAVQARHWTNLDVKVCGKTGTAQRNTDNPMGWFIAYAPADDPKYVIGANMDEVLSGATSAMYVVRDVFGAIYGQPDDYAVESTVADG